MCAHQDMAIICVCVSMCVNIFNLCFSLSLAVKCNMPFMATSSNVISPITANWQLRDLELPTQLISAQQTTVTTTTSLTTTTLKVCTRQSYSSTSTAAATLANSTSAAATAAAAAAFSLNTTTTPTITR